MKFSPRALLPVSLLALCLAGCEDDPPPAPPPPPPPAPSADPAAPANRPGARRNTDDDPPPVMQINDSSFREGLNVARDPFKSYFSQFVVTPGNVVDQFRDVKLMRYSLDDLRLVAVIVGTDSPYAMVVDSSRTGTVLRRGMYVGRQEFVPTPQGGYNTHWRVARIEPGRYRHLSNGEFEEVAASVVFERSNPLDPNAQVVERTITLASRTAGAQQNASGSAPIGPIPGVGGPTPGYLPPNLGGVGAGNANGAILGTQAAVQQAVNGANAPAPQPQTTVVVQVPPQQNTTAPAPPSTAPPPVQVFNGANAPPR